MDYYEYNSPQSAFEVIFSNTANGIAIVICGLIALIGGIAIYFTFLSRKNEGKFTGFLGWVYEVFNFKKLLAETLLKLVYLITASWITLSAVASFFLGRYASFGARFLAFILVIVFGNLVTRLFYEFALVFLIICRNTTEINSKMSHGNLQKDNNHEVNQWELSQRQSVFPGKKGDSNVPSQQLGVVFCRNCGNQFSSQETKCPNCGNSRQ